MRKGRMGKKDDGNSVVDTHGRVFGVKGLRVVDASTFYLTPPGHIIATVCEYTVCSQQKGSIKRFGMLTHCQSCRCVGREICGRYQEWTISKKAR